VTRAGRPGALEVLLALVDEAYDHAAWHGPNLRGSLRGLSPREASWRPAPRRHNVWELVVHAAYWKCVARRRLTGVKRGSFPRRGSNWFPCPLAGRAWRDDVALLDEQHRLLRETIAALSPSRLSRNVSGGHGDRSAARLIAGIAAHDVYHAGQIGLIRALHAGRAK